MDHDSNGEQGEEPMSLVALPTELLVYIISFLANVRDIAKLLYVSRRLRSVSEIPSLWKECIWPHLDTSEERCAKNVLKSCGQYIRRLSFPDHVAPSKLTVMLRHCSNLVKLSIPTSKLSPDHLGKLIEPMGKLQSLDIPKATNPIHLILAVCARMKELTVRLTTQDNVETILTEWAKKVFVPQALNVVSMQAFVPRLLIQKWFDLNPNSPTDHICCFKVYSSLKVPMDLFPVLPDFQLHFGRSCTLPFVKASKYGLLGLEEDFLLVTDFTDGSKVLHKCKATMGLLGSNTSHFSSTSDIASLNFVTHFDASLCQLHSGHLEQLAMACSNLLELNLRKNADCLKSLQGLRVIADYCKSLRGLNLLQISVLEIQSHIELWKILVDMRLTYLALEVCALIPHDKDKQTIVALYQKCLNLRALEFGYFCDECRHIMERRGELLILSNITSLIHIFTYTGIIYKQAPNAMQDIVDSCKMLKFMNYSICSFDFPSSLSNNLEQLCILSIYTDISNTFMDSLSSHGGLVHIFLCVFRVTADGVITLIENSPKLLTCQIHVQCFHGSLTFPSNLRDFKTIVKDYFAGRKLFSCGIFRLVRQQCQFMETLNCSNADLNSLWSQPAYPY